MNINNSVSFFKISLYSHYQTSNENKHNEKINNSNESLKSLSAECANLTADFHTLINGAK